MPPYSFISPCLVQPRKKIDEEDEKRLGIIETNDSGNRPFYDKSSKNEYHADLSRFGTKVVSHDRFEKRAADPIFSGEDDAVISLISHP